MNRIANGANNKLFLHVGLGCGSLAITRPVSLLANKFDVRSALHGQVSLTAVNQIYVFHKAMNCCKIPKIHERLALEMSIFAFDQIVLIMYVIVNPV